MSRLELLLPEASSLAPQIDRLFWGMVALCGVVAAGVFIAMIYFCIRYRRGSSADRRGAHNQRLGLELAWTLVPFALFVGVFLWSLLLFAQARTAPRTAETFYVVAKQWMWKVQHPGGQREINTLHVPLGVAVRLTMTSQDVIHSLYVPAFRIKQDVLPGRYTQIWFMATKLGTFPLFCAEYCGLDHSRMGGQVVVLAPAQYAAWLSGRGGEGTVAQQGANLFRSRGCSGCHGPEAVVHAPPLAGLYGRAVHLSDGSTVMADERYLHDSILLPASQVVAGYAPIMPAYSGQVTDEEVLALIEYIKSLAGPSEEASR